MKKKGILERLKEGPVLGDGGYLLELEKRGWVRPGPFTPEVAIVYPDALRELHIEFRNAGAEVLQALTFYASRDKLATVGLEDRVATAAVARMLGPSAVQVMAAAIMISTFGCANGLILSGARVYYAMARQRLFLPFVGKLNAANVPASSLKLQGLWAAVLVLPRTYNPATRTWGNLYSNLLEYVISAALIFYVLTVAGVFRLRVTRPNAPRPYRALG